MIDNRYLRKKNEANTEDYGLRNDPDFLRQVDSDHIYDKINNTNWKKESDYYNYTYKPTRKIYTDEELKQWEFELLSMSEEELHEKHRMQIRSIDELIDKAYDFDHYGI